MDDGLEQQALGVDQDMTLLAPDLLAAVIARRVNAAPPFSALLTLWLSMIAALGLASRPANSRHATSCHIERVVNAPERAVVVPSVEVVVQGAARRQVLGDRGPLAARAQDIHEAVDHLAQVDPPLVAAALGGRDQWGNQRPFLVAHVTWVAQLAPVVATTVLTRPHQRLPPDRTAAKGITTNSKHSRCSRMDT